MSGKKNSSQQQNGVEHTQMTSDPGRSAAEWVSLGVSLTILLALVGMVIYAYQTDGKQPPVIEVQTQLEQVRIEGDNFYLPLEIKNTGDLTAQEVNVQITLSGEQTPVESVALIIPVLAGGETASGIAVFQQDPTLGQIRMEISFLEP